MGQEQELIACFTSTVQACAYQKTIFCPCPDCIIWKHALLHPARCCWPFC